MKNLTLIISILFSVIPSHAQDYLISFSGNGASNTGETVKVENLTQGKSISLSGSDILHLKATVTGNDLVFDNVYGPLRIYPNPSNDYFTIEFGARKSGPAVITIYDLIGREISSLRQTLTSGIHSFRVTGLMSGIYTLKVFLDNQSHLGRLFSTSSTSSLTITYNGNIGTFSEVPQLKSATEERFWQYNSGDLLKFIGTSWKFSTVLMDVPTKSKTISFKFIECTDADGNNYPVVQIGDQWWMAENLKTTRYNDGAPIPNVTDNTTWRGLTTDAY
ncbi:MAG: T9SS type A sorting domain-containing protein [Bacteroidia bacterium]|nr:T9SS type A sorting domain-containing protein [Bacteroidia bacterium]